MVYRIMWWIIDDVIPSSVFSLRADGGVVKHQRAWCESWSQLLSLWWFNVHTLLHKPDQSNLPVSEPEFSTSGCSCAVKLMKLLHLSDAVWPSLTIWMFLRLVMTTSGCPSTKQTLLLKENQTDSFSFLHLLLLLLLLGLITEQQTLPSPPPTMKTTLWLEPTAQNSTSTKSNKAAHTHKAAFCSRCQPGEEDEKGSGKTYPQGS